VAPSLFAFVSDLAGRFSSKRRALKQQEKSTLFVPGANLPSGGKKEKQGGDARAGCSSGAGWSGGKYPEKFTIMEQRGINTSSAQEDHVRSVLTGKKKNRYGRRRTVALSAAVRTASRVFGDVNSGMQLWRRLGTLVQRKTARGCCSTSTSKEHGAAALLSAL
jgi:hypothetical protein